MPQLLGHRMSPAACVGEAAGGPTSWGTPTSWARFSPAPSSPRLGGPTRVRVAWLPHLPHLAALSIAVSGVEIKRYRPPTQLLLGQKENACQSAQRVSIPSSSSIFPLPVSSVEGSRAPTSQLHSHFPRCASPIWCSFYFILSIIRWKFFNEFKILNLRI